MREPAPPYLNEGPHALWHVSENPAIARFEPHLSATAAEAEPLVWAVDTRHLPFYWFPRDCPRGTFWADDSTDAAAATRLLGGASRVHIVEDAWLDRIRNAVLYTYQLPQSSFERHPEVGGYWVSRAAVEPSRAQALGDLVALHEQAGIALRVLPNLWPIWDEIVASTLEFSGMRLRNALPRPG